MRNNKHHDFYTKAPHLVCIEWAEQWVGLLMKVKDNWWDGCSGKHFHDARIASYDKNETKWMVALNDPNDPIHYPMRWDGVLEFVDEDASTFCSFPTLSGPSSRSR